MPRFKDDWVLDRVLFDYVSGGSCACCGFQHLFLPNGIQDLINAVSDLETDQADAEKASLQHHPWPLELRDQVWADRVRLRQKMKLDRKQYLQFWNEHNEGGIGGDNKNNNGGAFSQWLRTNSVDELHRLFQVPRQEISEMVQTKYNIHSAFGVVLCTVMEQVAYFQLTEYPPDARGDGSDGELDFEQALTFDRRCGFLMRFDNDEEQQDQDDNDNNNNSNSNNNSTVSVWLKRMASLGGPKLLDRNPSKKQQQQQLKKKHETLDKNDDDDNEKYDEEEGGADDVEGAETRNNPTPGFASDRRIIRLLIARYWADQLQKKYLASIAAATSTATATAASPTTPAMEQPTTTISDENDN